MKELILQFARDFDYPAEAIDHFSRNYDILASNPCHEQEFKQIQDCYAADMKADYYQLLKQMDALSEKAGIHQYTGAMLFLMGLAVTLKRYYAENGLDESIWRTCMMDLKWKLDECKCVHNIWGTFVAGWFSRFYNLTRFGFGKLQFEAFPFNRQYDKNGVTLTPESIVVNVHIPRTGGRLDQESLADSYAQAVRFFRERYPETFAGKPMVFLCSSWLLYPKHAQVMKPGSNLLNFFSQFEILENGLYENYNDVWRLFDVHYTGDVEKLPQDSSLRRTYADWIRKGEKTGWGVGIYIYDK